MKRSILSLVVATTLLGCAGTSSVSQETVSREATSQAATTQAVDVQVVEGRVVTAQTAPQVESAHKDGIPADTAGVHYKIYRPSGEIIDLETLIAEVDAADAVLIGEEHDDPIGHYLQGSIFRSLHKQRTESSGESRDVLLSLEMFSTDVQYIVDEYLTGYISEKHFLSSSRPWQNYKSDYRPSVEYAKENGLKVIAANAPRRYASRVTQNGPESLDELPQSAKTWLPPLPYSQASPEYIAEWNQTMRENSHGPTVEDTSDEPVDDSVAMYPNMLAAQSLWDATMAFSIAAGLKQNPGASVVHYVGAFHVENRTGIPEHLLRYRPGTDIKIVSIRSQDDLGSFDRAEDAGLGDYIIVTDAKLPRTHDRF